MDIVSFNTAATVICRHIRWNRFVFPLNTSWGFLVKKLHSLLLKRSTPLFKSPVEVETLTHTKPESEWETCPSARLPLRTQHTVSVPINMHVFGANRNYTGSSCSPVNALSHTDRGGAGSSFSDPPSTGFLQALGNRLSRNSLCPEQRHKYDWTRPQIWSQG